ARGADLGGEGRGRVGGGAGARRRTARRLHRGQPGCRAHPPRRRWRGLTRSPRTAQPALLRHWGICWKCGSGTSPRSCVGRPGSRRGRGTPPTTEEAKMKEQKFPPGWDEKRVQEWIAHYENQTEDEEFADIEAACAAEDITLMAIPTELVPEVRALLARQQRA